MLQESITLSILLLFTTAVAVTAIILLYKLNGKLQEAKIKNKVLKDYAESRSVISVNGKSTKPRKKTRRGNGSKSKK
tara:strand:- start:292 stop:522 length:231 start_codon:yes stop_codon:yes gene_type:complete